MNTELAFDVNGETYEALTPTECADLMFERTGADGTLVIPAWPYDDPGNSEGYITLKMDWNKEDLEDLKTDYEELRAALESIASVWDKLGATEEYNRKLLSARDFEVWNTYIRDFEIDGIDADEVSELLENKASGVRLFEEEEELCERYAEAIYADFESRLDSPLAAYDVIIRAKRLCRLMSLEAPECVINNEAKLLVQAMAVNRFGLSMEKTGLTA